VRLYPWQTVRGVDLRGETFRLWAHEHQSRWRLRLSRPALDTMADTPDLGRALAEFAAACSVMAEPVGMAPPVAPDMEDAVPAFLGRAAAAEAGRSPIRVESEPQPRQSVAPPSAAPAVPSQEASAAVPAGPAAKRAAPSAAEATVMDLERRLGLRGQD
jgi:hypothetical protein